ELEEGRPISENSSGAEEPSVMAEEEQQVSFFGFAPNPGVERLKSLDLMNLTPSEAFKILEQLKEAAEG
ncbi:hypothetical protein LH384_34345, partial [Pseudomonas aeruginosa]|nr:hypothetical protein [Pseudomonas aeruginosa]